ncbi:MAG: hypothetical protein PUC32_00005, partial [Oscillospiraceae bacterium]|nr:hypothetical protein [Oscillospiraceae bacterium]
MLSEKQKQWWLRFLATGFEPFRLAALTPSGGLSFFLAFPRKKGSKERREPKRGSAPTLDYPVRELPAIIYWG